MTDPQSGRVLFPGLAVGSEMQWGAPLGGPAPFQIAYDHFRYVAHADADWDWHQFDVANDVRLADEKDNGLLNATNANLQPFAQHNGKVLLWHGWGDGLISPFNTIDYYREVLRATPEKQEFVRLFMVPGMLHCGGGDGANQFDVVNALDRWVETGKPPTEMTAYHVTGSAVDRTRPLCPYPQVAKYNRSGSPSNAGNFVCSAARQAGTATHSK